MKSHDELKRSSKYKLYTYASPNLPSRRGSSTLFYKILMIQIWKKRSRIFAYAITTLSALF
jgi:hypothetical protein